MIRLLRSEGSCGERRAVEISSELSVVVYSCLKCCFEYLFF